ncbi:serine protease [Deinococcus malanensis]|uniref:Serine protease n=1 Tax=Deinococcus malanensis TaxID=1706855 RepID=A0ABQ2EZD5_9DEIO|nr:S1C family serine protease [Deinococcus malanensis]GGK35493.1 serine protease [Deinococcus malanensis]
MNNKWTAAFRGAVLTAVLLAAGMVDARTTPTESAASPAVLAQAAPVPSPATPVIPPAPLSPQESAALTGLFEKLRPATLRLEDCPPNDCSDPDGVGTGFLIGGGYALTAFHVIEGEKNLTAVTTDKRRYTLQVIGFDDHSDVALIRVNVPANTPYVPLATTGPGVGEPVLTIGNGNGTFLSSKTGRMTGLDREAGRAEFPEGTLEFNAPLLPGDSGGPVINSRGEAVGVVSYIRFSGRRSSRITAYAVPVTETSTRMADLRGGMQRVAPATGIDLDSQLDFAVTLPAEQFSQFSDYFDLDLGSTPGAFFTSVLPGSPADRAGLRPLDFDEDGKRISGDIIIAVNGQRTVNFSDFQFAVRRYQAGETVTLRVLRGGRPLDLKLVLVPRTGVRLNGTSGKF